jgi:Spy/CpxP family protein refolding chaperone
MRRVAAALFVGLVLPATVAAQASHAGDHGAHHAPATSVKGFEGDFAAHFKGIELSDALKTKMVALRDEWHAKMKVVKDEAAKAGTADAPATVKRLDEMKAAEHAAFRALLTPAQQKQFDENMKQHDAMDAHKKKDGGSRR